MATQIQLKRGLASNFEKVNLEIGEPAFVTDSGKLYVGDGTTKILVNPIDKPTGIDTKEYITKVRVNDYGQVTETSNVTADDIPDLPSTKITGLGSAAILNVGTASGNIPVLDSTGKLVSAVLPPLAITNTFVVSSQAAMLALDATVGAVAVRTDENQTYILQKDPASVIANWVKLLTPTDSVLSVNGQTGNVSLVATDINLTGYTKASSYTQISPTDSTSVAIGKLETNFSNYASLLSPNLTGSPTAPTATLGDKSTLLATTQFVQNAIATIDGGIF